MILACGLRREAREIGGDGHIIVVGGGDAARLEKELEAAALSSNAPFMSSSIERSRDAPVETPATAPPSRLRSRLRSNSARCERAGKGRQQILILSSGIAGALDPALRAGDIVLDGSPEIVAILHRALPHAITGAILGTDTIVATAAEKRALHATTGAVAADMESHIARRVALRHGLPFAALRVISDTADEDLPPAALIGMTPDGGMALGAVLASLARRPAQLPALIRTGLNAETAFRALGRAHHMLGGLRIELADLREFRRDVR